MLRWSITEIFPFVKDLNDHMKEVHPDVKFHWKYCPKVYDSHNTHYKHEASHFQYRYLCHYCTKHFQFPGLREKHERQHTGNNLLPCTWPGCKAQLSCQDALNQHIVTHNDQCFDCLHCNKDFNTISNLKQHIRGKNGDGFISLCGASFDWSDDRNDHQQDCTECSARKDKLQNKPEFLGKRKQWEKGVLTKITQYRSWKLQKLYINALTFHVFVTGAVYNGMDSLSDNVFHFVARWSRLYLYQSGRIYGNNSAHGTK